MQQRCTNFFLMPSLLNTELLSSMMKAKRGSQGLRAVAEEIGGISAATLSRVEQGNVPDVESFIRICNWLDVSTETFILMPDDKPREEATTKDVVVAHLRADRTLNKDAARTLIEVINHFYQTAG